MRFEYRIEEAIEPAVDALNNLGLDGWELVAVLVQHDAMIFKRQIVEKTGYKLRRRKFTT